MIKLSSRCAAVIKVLFVWFIQLCFTVHAYDIWMCEKEGEEMEKWKGKGKEKKSRKKKTK